MLSPLLPSQADNDYRGHKPALWLFAIVIFMRSTMSMNGMLNTQVVASKADGIPLDTYAPAAAHSVITLFALLSLANLMLYLIGIVVLIRYRSLVPLMFSVLLLQYLGTRLIHWLRPIEMSGRTIGLYMNLALAALMIAGLALSLHAARTATPAVAAP
jgi:hypothetical protein